MRKRKKSFKRIDKNWLEIEIQGYWIYIEVFFEIIINALIKRRFGGEKTKFKYYYGHEIFK